jgi:light-regulated signal transduction histidine kinase (bacteriophytochrome)
MTPAEQEALRYALSHDLRAPLRVVDGFARIVKEDYAVALGKLGMDHLDRVLAASARMAGMIDAILAQAQLGSTGLQRARVDVSALAQEVCSELGVARAASAEVSGAACTGVQFEVEQGLVADADPVMLRRVLDNLIGNAVKYSAKVAQPRVSVGRVAATNPAVFYVRDNGAGFDMQHADKLFGMFQRLHSAKEFPGTGVGLAGVQQIVRRHGGRVWAEAKAGEGACFYFTLMDIATAQQKLV